MLKLQFKRLLGMSAKSKNSNTVEDKTGSGSADSTVEPDRLPEDLEARRKEVQDNMERLFDNYAFFTKIIDTPVLVYKAHFCQGPGNPRWLPRVWGKMSTKPVEIHDTPGDHDSMIQLPHAEVLAGLLKEHL